MEILYSDSGIFNPKGTKGISIFLAGPTPRSAEVPSWRPEAIDIINKLKFDQNRKNNLTILVPERIDWTARFDYTDQFEWECDSLQKADIIAFWIPRNMQNMPALTTNVEFGYWLAKDFSKVYYGRPNDAENIRYLDCLYDKMNYEFKRPIFRTLEQMLFYILR